MCLIFHNFRLSDSYFLTRISKLTKLFDSQNYLLDSSKKTLFSKEYDHHNQLYTYTIIMNQLKELLKRLSNTQQRLVEYWKKTPSTKIIMINTGVYLMWKLDIIPEGFLVKHFSSQKFNFEGGRLHTLITYSFSHTGIFSLGLDVLMLGSMGKSIQKSHGNKYIYWLYGLGALFGGLTSSFFKIPSPYIHPQIGPESVIAAYVTFIGLINPQHTFNFILFPMRAWVLLILIGTYSLLFDPKKKVFAGMTAGVAVHQMMRSGFI